MATAKGTNLKPKPSIKSIELKLGDAGNTPVKRLWQVQALVENTGNVHAKIDVESEIRDSLGARVWSGALLAGKGTLIPGFPRYFRSPGIPSLRDGNYVVGTSIRVQGMRIGERGAQAFTVASGVATPLSNEGLIAASVGSIGINPNEVVLTGPLRSRRFSNVILKNQTDKPVTCQVNLGGWKIAENGTMRPCDPTEATRSAAGWIELGSEKLDLAPGASGKVQVSVTIPEQGAEGEYYAALLVETASQGDAKIAPSVVMVTVIPEKTSKPAVSSSSLVITPSSTAGYKFSVKAKNDGNIRITPSVDFIVQDSTGKKVGDVVTVAHQGEQLFPGVVKTLEAESARALANGKYTLVAEVSAGKDVKAKSLTIPFTIPLATAKTVSDKKPVSPGTGTKSTTTPKPAVKKPTK
ncbi:MAG: COG1470 family protein [Armatimonadota bacterium]